MRAGYRRPINVDGGSGLSDIGCVWLRGFPLGHEHPDSVGWERPRVETFVDAQFHSQVLAVTPCLRRRGMRSTPRRREGRDRFVATPALSRANYGWQTLGLPVSTLVTCRIPPQNYNVSLGVSFAPSARRET